MADQLFTDGDVKEIDGQLFECVGVGYTEPNGERENFTYSFRLKSELDAERDAAARQAEEEAERLRQAEEATNQPAPEEVQ